MSEASSSTASRTAHPQNPGRIRGLSLAALVPAVSLVIFLTGCPQKQPTSDAALPGPSPTSTLTAAQATQTAVAAAATATAEAVAKATADAAIAQAAKKERLSGAGFHVVKKGHNLWKIAKRRLKDPFLWPLLHEANAELVKNPHQIEIGWKLVVPKKWSDGEARAAREKAYAEPKR